MKIESFLICDDIRREMGNKLSLMGLYVDSIFIEVNDANNLQWPIPFRLGIFCRLHIEQSEVVKGQDLLFKMVVLLEGDQIAKFEGGVKIGDRNVAYVDIPLVASVLPLQKPGMLKFVLHIAKDGLNFEELTPPREIALQVRLAGSQ